MWETIKTPAYVVDEKKLREHVTIDYHITDYKLSHFRLYLLINL